METTRRFLFDSKGRDPHNCSENSVHLGESSTVRFIPDWFPAIHGA